MQPQRPYLGNAVARGTSLIEAKVGLAVAMLVYVLIACSLPVVLLSHLDRTGQDDRPRLCLCRWTARRRKRFVSRMNCLAAGAFLSVTFLDVLMDTIECVEDVKEALGAKTEFPIASLLSLLGFFLVLGIEELTISALSRSNKKARVVEEKADEIQAAPGLPFNLSESRPSDCQSLTSHRHDHSNFNMAASTGWIRLFTLVMAISIHSIFEGLAVGLSDNMAALLTLFGALSIHKVIIAFSIGFNMAAQTASTNEIERKQLWLLRGIPIGCFAIASPTGVMVGSLVSNHSGSIPFMIVKTILQGLACGTFIYVVFCELIPHEFYDDHDDTAGKLLHLMIGMVMIALVINFTVGIV